MVLVRLTRKVRQEGALVDRLLRKHPGLALIGLFPPIYLLGVVVFGVIGLAIWLLGLLSPKTWLDLSGKLLPMTGRLLVWPIDIYLNYSGSQSRSDTAGSNASWQTQLAAALTQGSWRTDRMNVEIDGSGHLFGRQVMDDWYVAEDRCVYRKVDSNFRRISPQRLKKALGSDETRQRFLTLLSI